jgi:RNA polymerase sigma-70 factor (ECF subfamily)
MGKARKGYKSEKYTTHEQDKELVLQAISGNTKAYNILAQKYKPILYTAAKRRLPHKEVEDLEDIVMAVMGTAFVKMHQYNPEKSKFFTWMVACLHNYINLFPKQKKRITADSLNDLGYGDDLVEYQIPDEQQFDLDYDKEQSYKLLRALIDKLPDDIGKAIIMKYFRDATNAEIAEEIGCDETHIYYKIKKGRELLKKMTSENTFF